MVFLVALLNFFCILGWFMGVAWWDKDACPAETPKLAEVRISIDTTKGIFRLDTFYGNGQFH